MKELAWVENIDSWAEWLPIGLVIWQLEDLNDPTRFQKVLVNPIARQILNEAVSDSASLESEVFPGFLKIEPPQVYAEVIRSATSQDLGEICYRGQTGDKRFFQLHAFPLPPQRVGVILQEVTEHRHIEEALKKTEQKLLFHIKQTEIGIIEWDVDFRVSEWNPAAEKIFGFRREDAIGHHASELIFMPGLQDNPPIWKMPATQKESVSSTYTNITQSGRTIICEWHSTPLVNEEGQTTGVISLVQDVTERQQAESALLSSEVRYRQLFESAQDGVLMIDAHTEVVTAANPFLTHLLGYSEAEILGKKLWELGFLSDREANQAAFRKLLEEGYLRFEDLPLQTKTGKQVEVEFISTVYTTAQEKVIQCSIRDITERKRVEAERQQFMVRLQQSNQALQDFASVASHDLQEPLRKIQAFGDRLKLKCGEALSPDGKDYLERMQGAAQRMQVLINDLLTFSRVATKGQPFVSVDLNIVIQEVLSDLEVRIQQVGAQVQVEPLPTIEADPLQMRQLLQNLISNGLKFHKPDKSPLIQIRSHVHPAQAKPVGASAYCQLEVIDNGIGFDEKYLDRIFTVFQRLHGRNEYEGTGVGLAICRKIVERHSGSITAQSCPNQGATFIVNLPLRQVIHH